MISHGSWQINRTRMRISVRLISGARVEMITRRVRLTGRLQTAVSTASLRSQPTAAGRRARARQERFVPPPSVVCSDPRQTLPHGSRISVRAWTKEWLRWGPNQRMPLAVARARMKLHQSARAQILNHPRKRGRSSQPFECLSCRLVSTGKRVRQLDDNPRIMTRRFD